MEKRDAEGLVVTIRAAYPNQMMPEATVSLLVAHLRAVDKDIGDAVIHEVISTSLFLPSVAELTRAQAAIEEARDRSGIPDWMIGYHIRTYGMDWGDAVDFARNRTELLVELDERSGMSDFKISDWIERWDDMREWHPKMSTPPIRHTAPAKPQPVGAPVRNMPPDVDALASSVTKPF